MKNKTTCIICRSNKLCK